MKYTILGFSQRKAVELGLDLKQLLILRWFVDYKDTDKMSYKIFGFLVHIKSKFNTVLLSEQ